MIYHPSYAFFTLAYILTELDEVLLDFPRTSECPNYSKKQIAP